MINRSERGTRLLTILLFAGLALRLLWGWRQDVSSTALDSLPDQGEYLQLGQNLLAHGDLSLADPRFDSVVYAYRMPGYPALIALCDARPAIVRAIQALMDTSTILAVWLVARRWLSSRRTLFAAALVAFNPYLIFFSATLLSETLFTAMLVWGLVLVVRSDGPWPREPLKRFAWFAGALLLCLSVLVRPGAIALPLFLGIGAALANRDRLDTHRPWPFPIATTMILLTAVCLFPWAARNRMLRDLDNHPILGDWVWTTTNDGITLYDGFNPDATGASDQRFVAAMPWTRDMPELARSRYFARLARDWMANHPKEDLRLAAIKIMRTWSPIPLSDQFGGRRAAVVISGVFALTLDVLMLLALRRSPLPGLAKAFLLIPAIYVTVAAVLSVGSLRYRIPAEAPMSIVAASALSKGKTE